MKKLILFACFCCFISPAFSQFTITADNFPLFNTENLRGISNPVGVSLIPSANGVWDLSAIEGGNLYTNNYVEEVDPFYTNAGVDVYIDNFKSLNANVGYVIYDELDFNNTGVEDKGVYIDPQAYGLGTYTGNPLDSLQFPFQGAIFPQGRKVMQFPATANTAWNSQSRRVVNFTLKVAALGLNNTPCQHIYTIFRSDSIAGWGKMRVYANGSPTIEYDVLINEITQYAIDSFFVNGAPAPTQLLTAFSMTQGQQTGFFHRYVAYREGYSRPLAIFNYTTNLTTPAIVVFDTEDLTPTTSVKSPGADFSTLLFPNPASSGTLTLQLAGNIPAISAYVVLDMKGQIVQNGTARLENGALNLSLNNQLPNGSYLLQVLSDKKQTLITEKFVLAR